ncbi:GSH-induced LITAF domain protein [Rosa rugosa]|uniref:GSH-induced LITAF domain protein n=1 Tax=Rosa rugosa TaxID=74645 RepID=UPI002B40E36D|nr:GSH-induced LITAF domain protein [Rosa rugosa]
MQGYPPPPHQAEMSKMPPQQQPPVMGEPVMGVPYYVHENPYQAGMVPPNAIYGDPKGVPLQQTIYRDTPAPFNCLYCGDTGLTQVRSKPSLASVVGCLMCCGCGFCFLLRSMDCLWHKYHYCSHCHQKVAEFEKSDPCIVMDPPNWTEASFAVPA